MILPVGFFKKGKEVKINCIGRIPRVYSQEQLRRKSLIFVIIVFFLSLLITFGLIWSAT